MPCAIVKPRSLRATLQLSDVSLTHPPMRPIGDRPRSPERRERPAPHPGFSLGGWLSHAQRHCRCSGGHPKGCPKHGVDGSATKQTGCITRIAPKQNRIQPVDSGLNPGPIATWRLSWGVEVAGGVALEPPAVDQLTALPDLAFRLPPILVAPEFLGDVVAASPGCPGEYVRASASGLTHHSTDSCPSCRSGQGDHPVSPASRPLRGGVRDRPRGSASPTDRFRGRRARRP